MGQNLALTVPTGCEAPNVEADSPIMTRRTKAVSAQNGFAKTSLAAHFKCQPDKIGGSVDT
jgi:hypothetical protein